MPSAFKALATINAWALFILSWLAVLRGYASMLGSAAGLDWTPSGMPPAEFALGCGFAGLVLSVVVMVLRKKME